MIQEIEIFQNDEVVFEAEICFAAPIEALERPGFIKIMGITGQERKHRAYMLAQRALIDFEEGSLEGTRIPDKETVTIRHEDQTIHLKEGCVLAMDSDQNICFLVHGDVPFKQMLSILNRAATRLIRLDVP